MHKKNVCDKKNLQIFLARDSPAKNPLYLQAADMPISATNY
jgi:hypothetical protein